MKRKLLFALFVPVFSLLSLTMTSKISSYNFSISSPIIHSSTSNHLTSKVHVEFLGKSENDIFHDSDLVLRGTVLSKQDIVIEDHSNASTYNKGLLKIKIDRLLYSTDALKVGDEIEVLTDCCSYYQPEDFIQTSIQKQYIVFLKRTKDTETVTFSKYAKYHVYAANVSTIGIEGSNYEVNDVYNSLKSISDSYQSLPNKGTDYSQINQGNTTTEKIDNSSFESQLQNLLNMSKGE